MPLFVSSHDDCYKKCDPSTVIDVLWGLSSEMVRENGAKERCKVWRIY